MYDLLIVGAGLTGATIAARLKQRMRICVVDSRHHMAGNCHDYNDCGTFVHTYGPHIFHSPCLRIVDFLSDYTSWIPYEHVVAAEILISGKVIEVPFPYGSETVQVIGRPLNESEVLECFFYGYSRKMWGIDYDDLPTSIKGRVPKNTEGRHAYFPAQFVAMPSKGYTHMVENMLDGVEVILGVGPNEWTKIASRRVVFTGRPDLIPVRNDGVSFGEKYDLQLAWRTLKIQHTHEAWPRKASALNYCHLDTPRTRSASYARLTGGESTIVSTETPCAASFDDLTPYYPFPNRQNIQRYLDLSCLVRESIPNVTLAGRLGSYKYLDMYQAVGQGMALSEKV